MIHGTLENQYWYMEYQYWFMEYQYWYMGISILVHGMSILVHGNINTGTWYMHLQGQAMYKVKVK